MDAISLYGWLIAAALALILLRVFGGPLRTRIASALAKDVDTHRRHQRNLRARHGAYYQTVEEIAKDLPEVQMIPGPAFVWDGVRYGTREEAEEARLGTALEKARDYYQERDRETRLIGAWPGRRRR